jgi:uncharacterized LabA/DUF88 family protein
MSYSAIFVDAGYLFAQGSVTLTGSKLNRSQLRLNEAALFAALQNMVMEKTNGTRLLRLYWYDAPLQSGLTAQQTSLANLDYIKLRLGVLNGIGQQKGVDSLIVTDLIELARNRAISDALLVSGDEDIRIGVQIAQTYGVCVHLLGLEADTTSEWDTTIVGSFLSIAAAAPPATAASPSPIKRAPTGGQIGDATFHNVVNTVVAAMLAGLTTEDLNDLRVFWATRHGLPPELDRPMLARCREQLGRDLRPDEKRAARLECTRTVQALPAYRMFES